MRGMFRVVLSVVCVVGVLSRGWAAEGKSDAESPVAAARHAVLQLVIQDKLGKDVGNGTAFLIDAEGYCLTNFHVVSEASGAVGVFTDSKERLPVELRAVDPAHDLALVKVTVAEGAKITPLAIEQEEIAAGEDVWALGYPLELGYTVNKGTVSGVRKVSELPEDLREELLARKKLDPRSIWLQTDCTINPGNSGGPLVNKAGRVVGINTMSLKGANNVYFALKISEARGLLGRKDEVTGFAALARNRAAVGEEAGTDGEEAEEGGRGRRGDTRVDGIPGWRPKLADVPRVSLPTAVPPSQLRSTVQAMMKKVMHECPTCSGSGRVTVKHNKGQPPNTWVETSEERCNGCGGRGRLRGSDNEMKTVTSALVKQLVSQNWEDSSPAIRSAIDLATNSLAAEWARDGRVSQVMDDAFYDAVTRKTAKVGDPICMTGIFVAVVRPSPGEPGTPVYVMWTGRHRRMYVVNAPKLVEQEFSRTVVFGGIYAGSMQSDVPDHVPVLQGGFILATK